MSSLGDASARAHSRAAVYQAIEDAYGAKKFNSKSLTNETQSLSQNTVTNNAVNIILDAINDKTQKSRQFITEIINGKQIVLENVKTVRDLKSSSKAKRYVTVIDLFFYNVYTVNRSESLLLRTSC